MVLDRRKRLGDRREPYKRLAKIKYYPGSLPRDCVVTDVSERSVNVVVEDDDVPAEFTLIFSRPLEPVSPAMETGPRTRSRVC
jgi:hypothetical protein